LSKFTKGQSGNPAGRPKGTKDKRNELRALLEPHSEELTSKLVNEALGGNMSAMKLCIDRLIPTVRPVDSPIQINALTGSLIDRGESIISEVLEGNIPANQGALLLSCFESLNKIHEIEIMKKQLNSLESVLLNRKNKH
jgi:hypothetical protein